MIGVAVSGGDNRVTLVDDTKQAHRAGRRPALCNLVISPNPNPTWPDPDRDVKAGPQCGAYRTPIPHLIVGGDWGLGGGWVRGEETRVVEIGGSLPAI